MKSFAPVLCRVCVRCVGVSRGSGRPGEFVCLFVRFKDHGRITDSFIQLDPGL